MTVRWLLVLILLCGCSSSSVATVTPRPSPTPTLVPYTPVTAPSPSPEPAQRLEAPLPAPIEETAAAAAGGKLYVMGGFDAAGNSLNSVYVFDGSSWSSGPRLPLGLDHASATSFGDEVFIAGGHSFGSDSARLFRLDPTGWFELAPMRHARGGHALIAAGGKLWAIGGNSSAGNIALVEAYDPLTNAWTDVTSLPQPRNHVSGFVLNGMVCVAGGRFPTTARVDCYDPASGAWSRLADLPAATSGAGAAQLPDGQVVVMGGQNANETALIANLDRYSNSAWTGTETMLLPRHGFELAVFNGRAWACGGGTAPGLHPTATCTSVG